VKKNDNLLQRLPRNHDRKTNKLRHANDNIPLQNMQTHNNHKRTPNKTIPKTKSTRKPPTRKKTNKNLRKTRTRTKTMGKTNDKSKKKVIKKPKLRTIKEITEKINQYYNYLTILKKETIKYLNYAENNQKDKIPKGLGYYLSTINQEESFYERKIKDYEWFLGSEK